MLVTITEFRTLARDEQQNLLTGMGKDRTLCQALTGPGEFNPLEADTSFIRLSTDTAIQLDIEGGATTTADELFLPGEYWLAVDGGETLAFIAAVIGGANANGATNLAGVGFTGSASFLPANVLYGAGDVIGASAEFEFTLADGSPVPEGSVVRILTTIMKIDVGAVQASEGAYLLQCYSATQPSAQADNDAWTLVSGDLASYRGSIPLGTPVDQGAALYVKSSNINLDIKLLSSSLWARLVTTPSFTPTAVARQVLLYGIVL